MTNWKREKISMEIDIETLICNWKAKFSKEIIKDEFMKQIKVIENGAKNE